MRTIETRYSPYNKPNVYKRDCCSTTDEHYQIGDWVNGARVFGLHHRQDEGGTWRFIHAAARPNGDLIYRPIRLYP